MEEREGSMEERKDKAIQALMETIPNTIHAHHHFRMTKEDLPLSYLAIKYINLLRGIDNITGYDLHKEIRLGSRSRLLLNRQILNDMIPAKFKQLCPNHKPEDEQIEKACDSVRIYIESLQKRMGTQGEKREEERASRRAARKAGRKAIRAAAMRESESAELADDSAEQGDVQAVEAGANNVDEPGLGSTHQEQSNERDAPAVPSIKQESIKTEPAEHAPVIRIKTEPADHDPVVRIKEEPGVCRREKPVRIKKEDEDDDLLPGSAKNWYAAVNGF